MHAEQPLCQLSLALGLHAYQSLLMIFTPVDAHSQWSGMLDHPSSLATADYIGLAWYCRASFVVHEFCDK